MVERTAFVCDEITPDMIALDELNSVDDLTCAVPVVLASDAEELVEITREITIDPRVYKSANYTPDPHIPYEPDSEDDKHDDLPEATAHDGAVAMDAAKPGSKANIPCKTPFGNCQAQNPLLCPYHGAKLIETDIKAGLAKTIPNAVVSVKPSSSASQAKGKNFSVSIKVPASQKLAAEKALDDFLQQPGIKSQGMKDWDPRSNEWSDFYDIDLLQTNQAPQGAMANRAALVNSVSTIASNLSSSQPSTTSTNTQQSPAAQAPSTQSAQQVQPVQQHNSFVGTSPSNYPPMSPAAVSIIKAAVQPLGIKVGMNSGWYGHTGNMHYAYTSVYCQNPTDAQNLANSLVGKIPNYNVFLSALGNDVFIAPAAVGTSLGWKNIQTTLVQPTSQSASVAATSTSAATQQTTTPVRKSKKSTGQQPATQPYQPMTDISDDKKFLVSMKGKAAANELADLEDLIDEKEQLQEQIDATQLAMSNGDANDQSVYQSILSYAYGGLKDVDEKVLDARENLDRKYNSNDCQPLGADCSQIKANLQAQGATFIPKALDGLDTVMQNKIQACQRAFVNAGLTEASNPATWAKIQDLVSQSLANYLTNSAIRSYTSGNTPDSFFFSDSTGKYGNITKPGSYYNNYSGDLMEDNYGIVNPPLREFRLCASATDPDKSAWANGQSDWTCDGCAFTIKKSNTFCAYTDFNTGGGYGDTYNGTPISKPSILSIGHKPRNYISWIRKMLASGKPDLSYNRAMEESITGNGHNEVHAFCGCDKSGKSEMILSHIESLEYSDKTDADTVVKKHATELKQYGVKVYYYDSSTGMNVEVQF